MADYTSDRTGASIDLALDNADALRSAGLDYYEEGTWTVGISSDIGGSVTTTQNLGHYTRVGNLVTVWFYQLSWTAKTGLGSLLRLTGLPYTSGAIRSAGSIGGSPAGGFSSIDSLTIMSEGHASFIYLMEKNPTNNTFNHLADFNLNAAGTIYGMTLTYMV